MPRRVRVFVKRGTMLEAYLRAGQAHQRFQMTVIVREHCAGQPWAEVVEAWRMAEEVTVGTIVHVARGITMLGRGATEVATSEFERALAAPLPAAVRAELEVLRDEARGGLMRVGFGLVSFARSWPESCVDRQRGSFRQRAESAAARAGRPRTRRDRRFARGSWRWSRAAFGLGEHVRV